MFFSKHLVKPLSPLRVFACLQVWKWVNTQLFQLCGLESQYFLTDLAYYSYLPCKTVSKYLLMEETSGWYPWIKTFKILLQFYCFGSSHALELRRGITEKTSISDLKKSLSQTIFPHRKMKKKSIMVFSYAIQTRAMFYILFVQKRKGKY